MYRLLRWSSEELAINPFTFPKWTNWIKYGVAIVAVTTPVYVGLLLAYGATPYALDVGYQPAQPVPYSHALHAGQMGMDCRYCHTAVESTAHANIPPTTTCVNCHAKVFPDSDKLRPVRESYATGQPVEWVRIHDLPDYSYFNHSAHVTRGIGCVTCHGRVDRMEVVYQDQPLSMSWCLDCHRNPEKFLRPVDQVTNMDWDPLREVGKDQITLGLELKKANNINPSTDCSTCHR